jgi:tetratricopeptide (TPR) repeat protein
MKVVLIVLAVVFVGGFVTVAANPFAGTSSAPPASADPLAQVNAQYQPAVAALTSQLQSEPTSYTALVSLGNAYFDWALGTQQIAQQNTAVAGADQPLWISAKDAYSRAVVIRADEPSVLVDYAITQFYTGQTDGAIETATLALEVDPKFAPAYFNLGVFHSALGETEQAVVAFSKAIELDPEGQSTNVEYAKQQLEALGSADATTSP